MPLIDILDFNRAFRRIDQDRRDDAWPDVVGYRDFKHQLGENLQLVQATVQNPNRYRASLPLSIDLPKRGYTLRPGVVPRIDDRIVYQALADLLAPHFTPEPSVYSNRLMGQNAAQMFIPGVGLWVEFQNQVETHCRQYPYVIETDITAYFDHINHDLLGSRISDLFRNDFDQDTLNEIKILMRRLLGRWNFGLKNFGIPQINDASSFMANLYLDELDKWLLAHGWTALRYVDDIRVFAESEPEARKALADLIVKLREMGLYIASGKTRIRTSLEVLDDLERGRNQVRQIEAQIDTGDPDQVEQAALLLQDFFLELVSATENFNDRLFRFCVNRFKRLYVTGITNDVQDRVIHEVVQRLQSMPESTDIFVDYLSLFSGNANLQGKILDFLEGPYNIYPWQEMHLLEFLVRSNIVPGLRVRANQFACSLIASNRHPASRAKAFLLRGKNGTYADRRDIRSQYVHENREDVKRSIVVAIQEMRSDERDYFYQGIVQDARGIGQVVGYVQSLPEPKYYYYNPPNPYELIIPDDTDDLSDLGSEYFV